MKLYEEGYLERKQTKFLQVQHKKKWRNYAG
jgi:hypothetical protein